MPRVSFTKVSDLGYLYKYVIAVDEKPPMGVVAINWTSDAAPTGVCGTQIYKDFKVVSWIPNATGGFQLDPLISIAKELVKLGVWRAVNKFLTEVVVNQLSSSNYNAMFGGRVNITKDEWINSFGIYSAGIANYVKQKKLGTITASHLYVNPTHSALSDNGNFAIHQTFIWTKPKWHVVDSQHAVIQIDPENLERFNKHVESAIASGLLRKPELKLTPAYDYTLDGQVDTEVKT